MTSRLNIPDINWLVSASAIQSNFNQNLTLDASGSSSDVIIRTDSSNVAVFGSNTIASTTYSKSLNVNGPFFTNSVSAMQIPYDTSNNRPNTGLPGYIRYNTDNNLIEYWSLSTNSWASISEPAPAISSVSPSYVSQDVSAIVYTVSGANFNSFSSVFFIGNNDLTLYPAASTSFITNSQLTVIITDAIADASNNTAFSVRVINTNTNFSSTTSNIVTYNRGPFFNTAPNTNLGTGISGQSYTFATSPFTDLSGSDIPPQHLPLSYISPSTPLNALAPSVTLDPSGRLIGTMPNATVSTNYSFSAYVQDALLARSSISNFLFTVTPPALTYVSGTALPTPTYVNSSNTPVGGPVVGGFTIYSFTNTSSSYVVRINTNISGAVRYLIIAGGGGGGPGFQAGGGGAGGVLLSSTATLLSGINYTITVGAGGAGGNNNATNPSSVKGGDGGNSTLVGGVLSLTSVGGGGGGSYNNGVGSGGGRFGGSGGGAGATSGTETGGTGTPGQGSAGGGVSGYSPPYCGGGGGGYGAVGSPGGGANLIGDGGIGITSDITGTSTNYAGGGGGGSYQLGVVSRVANRSGTNTGSAQPNTGGVFGGGYGALGISPFPAATAGTPNTGGGGGGGALSLSAGNDPGANGGSGIIIIRFPSF